MINHSSIQKFSVASALAVALISAQAQTADGTVVISGQVSANTCKLTITDGAAGSTNNGVRSVNLGTVAPPSGTVLPNSLFGNQVVANFSLTSAAGAGTTCTFASGSTSWNIVLDLQASQVGTAGGSSFLANSATSSPASNVGVALRQAGGTRLSTLATGAGYLGTKISTNNALATGGLQLIAQFVTTSTTAPTSGLFSATVPLLVVYQ